MHTPDTKPRQGDRFLRRERMLAIIREFDFVTVAQLSESFDVSVVTVRADLAVLAERGEIHRVPGGASPRSLTMPAIGVPAVRLAVTDERLAVARAAAVYVDAGDSVAVDGSPMGAAFARALAVRDDLHGVTVFTNGLRTALALEPAQTRITTIMLGGTIRWRDPSLVEPMASAIIDRVHVKTAILSCGGIDPRQGVTSSELPEASVGRKLLAAAGRRIVLAEASSLGRVDLARICSLAEVDLAITGSSADPAALEALRDRGLELRVAA